MDDAPEAFDWRAALRRHRVRLGISQSEVARRAGLSRSAVRAYERGDRQPSRKALEAILQAIGLTLDDANPIRGGAGFAVDWRALGGRYIAHPVELRQEADSKPWPVFITNQGSYVVHWNRAFELVWDVDVERDFPDPLTRNLLAGASITRFARCIVNYDETMAFFFGLVKGDPRWQQDLERPAPWNEDAVRRLFEGDAGELRRLLDAWERATPIMHRVRHYYRVEWRHPGDGQLLRFIGQITACDIWNDWNWQEWIPADGETWFRLESLATARRTASGEQRR